MLKCCEFRNDVTVDEFSEWFASIDFDGSGECVVGWAFANETASTIALLFNECDADIDVDDTVGKPKVSTDVADNAANILFLVVVCCFC